MTEAAISQIWENVNEVLELQEGEFNMELLRSRQWYLQTLSILFPFLEQEWNKIQSQVQSEEAAIDRILLLLTQEGALPKEYLTQIKGRNVVNGNHQTIMTLMQVVHDFVEQALQEGEQPEKENYQQQNQQDEGEEELSDEYNSKMQQKPIIRSKSPMVTVKADSEPDLDRNANSVLGIGNQFDEEEPSEEYQQPNFDKVPQGFNMYMGQNPTIKATQSKVLKATHFNNQADDEEDQFDQGDYLHHKLNKCKSQDHLKKMQKQRPKVKKNKKVVTLITHPPIPKHFNKAKTGAEKRLTRDVKTVISGSRKVFDKENYNFGSPAGKNLIERKKREVNYYATKTKPSYQKKPKRDELQLQTQAEQSINKVKKLLKWKEVNLKRQQRQVQQDLEMKVQLKKQTYVKKINKLILNLEKEKTIQNKKGERERQRKEKEVAEHRLQAIEQQYRDQLSFINSRSSATKKTVAHTDHRIIIENLERELKRENEKKINSLKTRMKRQEAQLDDDLQKLNRQIIRAYKRN